jgi:hypothetical protein
MLKWLQYGLLTISLVVLALAAGMFWKAKAHERRLVEEYEPRLSKLYSAYDIDAPPQPQTVDELLASFFKLVEKLSG